MLIGIVGAGKEKFTPETEKRAREIIRTILLSNPTATITSGHSPVEGIDIVTEEEFYLHPTTGGLWIRAPIVRWWGKGSEYGFMARNTDIAQADLVVVIVVKEYPPNYKRKPFDPLVPYCYHCKDRRESHVKSGACWTGWKALEFGHQATWYIL